MNGLCIAAEARLRETGAFDQVAVGTSVADVEAWAVGSNAGALVVPLGDRAAPIREAGFRVTQQETHNLGVVISLSFPGGFAQFEPACDAAKVCLRGWSPEGSASPVQYLGGRLLSYEPEDSGRWLHLLEFAVTCLTTIEDQS